MVKIENNETVAIFNRLLLERFQIEYKKNVLKPSRQNRIQNRESDHEI